MNHITLPGGESVPALGLGTWKMGVGDRDEADQLRALARAQHVAIDASVSALAELRAAIIAGTAQRIADRRAAAS